MSKKPKLKIIPLGGIDEIGKNMTVLECEDDIIVDGLRVHLPQGGYAGNRPGDP